MRRLVVIFLILFALFVLILPIGLHFGQTRHNQLDISLIPEGGEAERPLPGVAFGTAASALIGQEIDGFTGWRPNDLFFWGPDFFADNNANRQLGILQAMRETMRVFKDHLTKISSEDYDPNLVAVDNLLRNDPEKWAFPSAESRYAEAQEKLDMYVAGLQTDPPTSRPIHARNIELMRLVQTWTDLLGAVHADLLTDEIDWLRIDDAFYHANGVCHVIAHMIPAIEIEYQREFQQKPILKQLLEESSQPLVLCGAMKPVFVLNGGDTSLIANQRRNLDAYVTEARQKLYSIREELDK